MAIDTRQLWQSITPVYESILEHPFLRGLTSGELGEEAFRHYVVQDAIYLRSFGRGLALLGAKAEDDDHLMMFCEHAANAIVVERALHKGFLDHWKMDFTEATGAAAAPNCLLYTSYLLRVAYERPYYEGLGAFLPCYWIYREVGQELLKHGSPHPLYQQWIDTYGGEEFGLIVKTMLGVVDSALARLTPEQGEAVQRHFMQTARFEYMFWDMGYRLQGWPV